MTLNKEPNTDSTKTKIPIGGQDTSSTFKVDPIAAELSRTDLGQLINEYKNVVILIIVGFFVGAVAFVGWKSMKSSEQESARLEVMNFKSDFLTPVQETKKSLIDLHGAYNSLLSKVKTGSAIMELSSEVVTLIRKDNGANTNIDWIGSFQTAQKLCPKNDFCYLHFGLIVSNFLEDQQKFDAALEATTNLIGNPYIVEDKLYFDLVRLAHAANKIDKKNQFLDVLKKKHMTSNYTTLAEQI